MKTPQELDKIYNRLPKEKTELSVEKVELNTLSDLTKSDTKIKSFLKKYSKILAEVKEFSKTINRAKEFLDEGQKLEQANVKIAQKFVAEFKELGLPLGDLRNVKAFMENGKVISSKNNQEIMYLHFINWKSTIKKNEISYNTNAKSFIISYNSIHNKKNKKYRIIINSFKNIFWGYWVKESRQIFYLKIIKNYKKFSLMKK